ncbi:type II toxin-antitoxin system VapC family toxin [Zymobacter palmae]|uniref:type II toxin-antitoxin system VapC family toxin n=1 Tax=Zymobacter palmae TaxID=33074 RepID=UPI000A006F2B|nr:PIN domain-containing protein [Zymobacter palmae]
MKIVIDTNILIQVLDASTAGNNLFCPRTGSIVENPVARTEALIDLFEKRKDSILIPSPSFAETLVHIEPALHEAYHNEINGVSCFEIVSFDAICAIECARMISAKELAQMEKGQESKKVSFDRQIIAICKAYNADELWTHDKQMFRKADTIGIVVKSLSDISPSMTQMELTSDELETAKIIPISKPSK